MSEEWLENKFSLSPISSLWPYWTVPTHSPVEWISRKSISKGVKLSGSMYKFEICFATEWINWKSFSRRLTRVRRPNWPIGGFKDQQMQAAQCTVGSSHFSLQKCRAGAARSMSRRDENWCKKVAFHISFKWRETRKNVTHSWINSCNRIERTHFKVFLGSVSSELIARCWAEPTFHRLSRWADTAISQVGFCLLCYVSADQRSGALSGLFTLSLGPRGWVQLLSSVYDLKLLALSGALYVMMRHFRSAQVFEFSIASLSQQTL